MNDYQDFKQVAEALLESIGTHKNGFDGAVGDGILQAWKNGTLTMGSSQVLPLLRQAHSTFQKCVINDRGRMNAYEEPGILEEYKLAGSKLVEYENTIRQAAELGMFTDGQLLVPAKEKSMAEKYANSRPMVAGDIGIA